MQRIVARLATVKKALSRKKTDERLDITTALSVKEMDQALNDIARLAQCEYFTTDVVNNIQSYGFDKALEKYRCNDLKLKLKSLCKLTPESRGKTAEFNL